MSDDTHQHLEVEDIGDVTVVSFRDKKILDEETIQGVTHQLSSLVEELGRKQILLNFGKVLYLSSAALGAFITLNKKVNAAGGRLVLCNIDPQIYEVFEITKLNKLFNIDNNLDANFFNIDNDPDANLGGVKSRLVPPKPTSGFSASLRPPPPDKGD